jgi:hypothetical protein
MGNVFPAMVIVLLGLIFQMVCVSLMLLALEEEFGILIIINAFVQ